MTKDYKTKLIEHLEYCVKHRTRPELDDIDAKKILDMLDKPSKPVLGFWHNGFLYPLDDFRLRKATGDINTGKTIELIAKD
jgi:hypothetical protein